jgi:alpha-D-xyloside xylohydrolase
VWQWDNWQPGMALVDFTNPGARRWFTGELERLLDMGVDCFKTDFGERIPTDVVYHDGSDPELAHNAYTHLYNQTVFELLERRRGRGDAVVFARSAMAGGQQFPVHGGGDCESTFEAMARACGAVSRSACPASGSGATTSAGSRGPPIPSCSSAGSRSACSRATAVCTARRATACPGSSTRSRWTCFASSRT